MYGAQMGLDGSNYLMLQYKYKSDDNNPPKELIKATFDEKNKITGIQPVQRQEVNYQPPIVTTKIVPANDSTHFSITILDNSFDVKIRDKTVSLKSDKEVNDFIEMNKSLIDPNKISIFLKANIPFDRFKSILDVLKKHGYDKFQVLKK
jgi:biopolymer transport protein ExbD